MDRGLIHIRLQLHQRALNRATRDGAASGILLDLDHVVIGMLTDDEIRFGPTELRSDGVDAALDEEARNFALESELRSSPVVAADVLRDDFQTELQLAQHGL